MARIKFGAIVTEASGSLGGHTIQHSKGGMQIRTKPKPTESFNNLQYQVRRKNPCLQYSWKALSAIQKTAWDRYAVDHDIRAKKGNHEILSGHSLWMKYQYYNWNEECNLPVDPATASLLYPTFADYVPPVFQPIVPPVFPPHVDPPDKPVISLSGYLALCEGQTVSLISSYGDFYLWSTGATTHTITVNTPGNYTVKVGNVGGLWSVDSDPTVVTIGSPPAAPVITVTDYLPGPVDDPNYILLIGEGSFATLTSEEANSYIWSTGEITRSIQVSATGFYTVRVANAQGCLSPLSQRITVQSYVRPPQPVITPSGPLEFCSFDPLCNAWVEVAPTLGAETHILSLAVLNGKLYGGTYPNGKLYEWNNVNAWVEVAPKLGAETYILSLAVFNGKLYGGTYPNGKLYEWNNVNAWVEVAPTLGAETYILSLAVFNGKLYGGTLPNGKLYEWNNVNAWVEVAPKLGAETEIRSLAVFNGKLYGGTNPNGKLYEWNNVNAWVEVAPTLGAETSIFSLAVFNGKLYGGTIPNGKLYEWNNVNAWVEVAPKLGAETYIRSLAVLNGKLYGGTYPNGKLYEWGRASVILESSEAESYLWSTGETTRTITVLVSGSYTVTIKTAAGYESLPSADTVVTVNEPAKPVITPSGPLDIPSGGSVDLESSVGTTYLWNTGETTRTITVTTSGSYTVQVYDVNGCISLASDPAVVTVHDRGFKTRFVVAGDAAGRTIVLPLVQNRAEGALAYDFTVNWGDNSSSHIESYNAAARSHTFAAAGTYDVEIWGTCEGWSFNGGGSCNKITHILDFGVANGFNGFKYLKQGFNGCVQLISICAGGFLASGTGCLTDGFEEIFKSCYYLPSVPADLFRYHPNVTTNAFKAAFNQCGSLASIPSNLFRYNTAASTYAFYATFHSCSTLAAIPTDTYRDNILVSTSGFALCHNGNYALTSLPADLFRYNTAVSSDGFYGTFGGCDLLATYGANLFKYNILCSGNCFVETFDNCPVLQVRADTFYAAGESGTRFHDQSPSFDHCFYRYMFSGTQGTAPDLWNCDFGTGSPYTFWCFYGDGNNIDSLANYYSIPSEWLYEPE